MASGDLKYEEIVEGKLTTAQRLLLRDLVAALWPGQLVDLQSATFRRDGAGDIGFSLSGEQTKAPAQIPIGCKITGRVP